MSRTKVIYFLSAIVLIIGCFALNESYSLFVDNDSTQLVETTVPTINTNLEQTTFQLEENTKKIIRLNVINNTKAKTKYAISVIDIPSNINVSLVDKENNDIVGEINGNESKEILLYVINNNSSESIITFSLTTQYATIKFDKDTFIANSNIDCVNKYILANEPVLAEGMIPVIYDEQEDIWKKTKISDEWYSYEEQKWANAVTVTSVNREKYLSENYYGEISMDDINTMWVWIPRFKYKILSNINSSNNVPLPEEVEVIFEKDLSTTGVTEKNYRNGISSDGTNTNFYTHPSFKNINDITFDSTSTSRGGWDKELKGYWVGKFETGTSSESCNTSNNESSCKDVLPIIKPNVLSLRNQNVSTQFLTSLKFAGGTFNETTGDVTFSGNSVYGLPSTVDSHMMKGTEWGAVALLSQSQYGKMGNPSYENENKEVFINNSSNFYTGRCTDKINNLKTENGTYEYNETTKIISVDKATSTSPNYTFKNDENYSWNVNDDIYNYTDSEIERDTTVEFTFNISKSTTRIMFDVIASPLDNSSEDGIKFNIYRNNSIVYSSPLINNVAIQTVITDGYFHFDKVFLGAGDYKITFNYYATGPAMPGMNIAEIKNIEIYENDEYIENVIPYIGTAASTTGTIYGIYDMSGGSVESIMSNYNNMCGTDLSKNSGFNGNITIFNGYYYETHNYTSGLIFPNKKYYDLYLTDSNTYILGDMTWETKNWYNDYNTGQPTSSEPWGAMNGYVEYTNGVIHSGIFNFADGPSSSGAASESRSWRAVLMTS